MIALSEFFAKPVVGQAFEQAGFDLDSNMGKAAYGGMGAGWPAILKKIGAVIEGE